ncbi:hemin-degrading factor [Superficieibacter electus]|uniref:Hemin-degrading factor n=1 Tax=Superficieibacter electus TaxID=2022662 RepID=A0A2P5GNS5_9ENTR|nr:ChuX/HutX family heme-like substrate-binding protein [Superficieibacter electus]POP44026.1 hemin-degrading factor [Superficieibacter electus]POP48198.1 hemin-degrading factor [Superficieibacter electus]
MSVSSQGVSTLWQQYQSVKVQEPAKYARDIATDLGVSEAQLAHARVGHDAVRLTGEMRDILAALELVGETKCICRNDYAVHEHTGSFTNQHIGERAGIVLNPRALDLRLFITQWASAFSLREHSPRGERQSIQFFDHQGDAVLKVYLTAQTDKAAWDEVIARFTTSDNQPLTITASDAEQYAQRPDAAALDREWRAMTDVHQFFGLLKTHNLSRQQAFRLVGDDLACQVDNDTLPRLLDTVLHQGNEIMIFVGNRGCVQIFTGALEKLTPMKGWINIFNEHFTLHLRDAGIAESWITRKPTADGHVTSLELFAADGTQIAQLYGQRSEGQPEQTRWREQIDALCNEGKAA